MPMRCEDKDAILAYLYDEVDAGARARIETHLASCDACRAEVTALRALRTDLSAWAPPERDLGFAIVDRARVPVGTAPRWAMPAWGLAAAAALVLAAAAAIASLEVSYGADGFTVRAGRSRGSGTPASPAATDAARADAAAAGEWRAELTKLERRLRDDFASKLPRATAAADDDGRDAADLLRRVRALIAESETRQQRDVALRLAELLRDFDRQRQSDLVRIQYGLGQLERSSAADREMVNHLVRVSQQR